MTYISSKTQSSSESSTLDRISENPVVDKVYRHTLGRVSKLAQTLVFTAGLIFQSGKIVIKGVVSPLGTLLGIRSWSFEGVRKDAVMWRKYWL